MLCFYVFEDNQGAVQLSKNPVSNSNSKRIDVRHHLFRELIHQGTLALIVFLLSINTCEYIDKSFSVRLFRDPPTFLDGNK